MEEKENLKPKLKRTVLTPQGRAPVSRFNVCDQVAILFLFVALFLCFIVGALILWGPGG